jgi:hypothetical protein
VKLPTDKREADAEFEQKILDVVEQTLFEVTFMCVTAEREKIKIVWVFERLFGEIGLRRRQGALKVGDGFAFAFVQLRFNVVREHRAGPAVFDGLVRIPEPDERECPALSRAGDYVPTAIPKWALAEPMWPILSQAVRELRFWILSQLVRVFQASPAKPDKSYA